MFELKGNSTYMKKREKKSCLKNNLEEVFLGIIAFIVIAIIIVGAFCIVHKNFQLDQQATTILGTTAGIVGSMFGLTAASYAFIWADLRSDRQENRHLGKVLDLYSKRLWKLFTFSLVLTVIVIVMSLVTLALVQKITDPTLSEFGFKEGHIITRYQNQKFCWVSILTLINAGLSIMAICFMASMNWLIFKRDSQYSKTAGRILETIQQKYDMNIFDLEILDDTDAKKEKSYSPNSIEYEKIHNLEILVERILKNHESIGDAFSESQRREKLLSTIITNELYVPYGLKNKDRNFVQENLMWHYLDETKRKSRWEKCRQKAITEFDLLHGIGNKCCTKAKKKPCECDFISVYDDLLTYRDNSLVWQEQYIKKSEIKEETEEFTQIYKQRALRYTIKKRLLIFYLRGEMFSNMDLSGVSFSGADLRGANFSDCNLTGIRLKGANCEGTDFTRCRMTGMYFADILEEPNDNHGEIQLSCKDIPDEAGWNPYIGREITYLQNATFKGADVSRAYLKAPGQLKEYNNFPYADAQNNNVWKLDNGYKVFSLEGTNFDHAKMFFSYFKNVNFTNSSLAKAQMYNTGLIQTKAKSANFMATTLTNACMAWCDFENADFSDASLVETILIRTNFHGANMRNVNFAYSNIISCNFEGASCQNASFKNIVQSLSRVKKLNLDALSDVDLEEDVGLRFDYATLTNTDFSGAELNKVSFFNTVGQNCIFTKTKGKVVKFDSAIFNSSVFNADQFDNASLKDTIMQNSVFINVKFTNSVFEKADLSGSIFTIADKKCFMGGYMYDVDFSNVKGLSAANFKNMCLKNVNFIGTGIKKSDFYDNPNGVTIVNCKF